MRPDPLASCVAWTSHPLSVAGLILLPLNGHVLKSAWPGVVTGKLSDFAGMLMFPSLLAVLLAAVLPRARAHVLAGTALAVPGVGFAVVKSSGRRGVGRLVGREWTVQCAGGSDRSARDAGARAVVAGVAAGVPVAHG